MLSYRAPLEIETSGSPSASVIWLHGLGANGFDFLPVVDELAATLPLTRFIFPHAAEQPVTMNGGHRMPSWYDIIALSAEAPEDEVGIRASIAYVNRLIEREMQRGIASQRIVLAGFSQGGNVALNAALRCAQPLAGALILSSYLGLKNQLAADASAANRGLPIFMAHGTADDVVPYPLADSARVTLRQFGYRVEWHEYAMPHTLCAQEVADIGNWLANVLAV